MDCTFLSEDRGRGERSGECGERREERGERRRGQVAVGTGSGLADRRAGGNPRAVRCEAVDPVERGER